MDTSLFRHFDAPTKYNLLNIQYYAINVKVQKGLDILKKMCIISNVAFNELMNSI